MADPLCRWRYASPKTVAEIVRALPKTEQSESDFLLEVQTALSGGGFSFDFSTFQKTAYQLAVQLGLYYIDAAGIYHPRFNHDIDEDTAAKYLAVVARCYVAPNPYTNAVSFGQGQLPVNLFSALLEHASTLPDGTDFDVATALRGRFSAQLGNPDAITALMGSTSVFTKVGSKNLSYTPILRANIDREAFFNLVDWPARSSEQHSVFKGEIISAALKLFQQKRVTDWLAQGREVNARLREYFELLTEQSLDTMTEDKIDELFLGVKDATGQHIDLVTMWAGRNGNGWSNIDPGGDGQKVQKIRDYLVRLKHDTALASTFWAGADPDRPLGFGSSVVTELLMKFHPDEVLMYAKEGCVTLKQLGLIEFDAPNADNGKRAAEFKLVQAAGTIILAKMRAMNIDKFIKSDGTGDGTPADYMTVNEFLCFVKEKFQEIQKEVLKMNMTTVQPKPYDQTKGKKKVFGTSAEDRLMKRIVASLATKPFVILAGHSGTGKSRMVKKLAYMTCRDTALHSGKDPLNYCMIEVKPNWHDSTELLGYFSSFGGDHYVKKQLIDFIMRAYAYPNVPFFVCLDEMNLAPVEQYFAEFLSALEDVHVDEDKAKAFTDRNAANVPTPDAAKEVIKYSSAPLVKPIDYKENTALLAPATTQANDWLETHGLTIPKNLFVVGTVNMDESTNQFSRKVLDRAFTIEMTDASFEDFGDATKDPEPDFVKEEDADHSLIDALLMGGKKAGALTKKTNPTDANEPNGQLENMNALKGILDGTPFVVAYRFANEYALYEAALNKIDADGQGNVSDAQKKANAKQAFDDVVLAKLLPRIAGETPMVKGLYMGTKKKDGTEEKPGLLSLLPYAGFPKEGEGTDTESGLKMKAILARPNQPYLTFWP